MARPVFLESVRESQGFSEGESSSTLMDLKANKMVFSQVVEPTFRDLDLADGSVVQWRPYKGKPSIVIDPNRSFGKPPAADYGVPTSALAGAAKAESSAKRVARLFELPVAIVNDAVDFERSLLAA